jgi:hypothetical protein
VVLSVVVQCSVGNKLAGTSDWVALPSVYWCTEARSTYPTIAVQMHACLLVYHLLAGLFASNRWCSTTTGFAAVQQHSHSVPTAVQYAWTYVASAVMR